MLALTCWPVDSWLIVTIRRKISKLISVMRSQHLLHISNCLNTTSTHIYIVLYRCMYGDVTCRCCKCLHMIDYIVLRVLVAGDFISLVSTVWLLIPIKEKEKISALNWRLSNVNMMIVTRVHLTSFTILSSNRSCAGGLRVAACKGSNYEGGGPLFSFSSISLCICRCCYVTVKVRQLGIDLLQNLSGKTPTWPHYWTELTLIWWEYLTL